MRSLNVSGIFIHISVNKLVDYSFKLSVLRCYSLNFNIFPGYSLYENFQNLRNQICISFTVAKQQLDFSTKSEMPCLNLKDLNKAFLIVHLNTLLNYFNAVLFKV